MYTRNSGAEYSRNFAFWTGSSSVFDQQSDFASNLLSTTYSLVISKVNETVDGRYADSISFRVTVLKVEDNYDGVTTRWGKSNDLKDAVQVLSIQLFQTSGDHQMRFTVTYELYSLLLIGYTSEPSLTRSFNVSQSIL